MDESVIRSMAKWPDVPAVYGWLSLDRRGDWRLKGERIAHAGAVAFINRNYAAADEGRWYFQNGPQRAYVRLDYTPWVYRLDTAGALVSHTEAAVDTVQEVYLDEHGNLLLHTPAGIGVVDDRDLDALSDRFRSEISGDDPARLEAAAQAAQQGRPSDLVFRFGEDTIPVRHVSSADLPRRFGFDPDPQERGTPG